MRTGLPTGPTAALGVGLGRHALRDVAAGVSTPPEWLDRRSVAPPPEAPYELSAETARRAVDVARRVALEFHQASGREPPDRI